MLPNLRHLDRWRAAGLHLALSALIFLGLLAVIVGIWYPGVLLELGGWQGVRIVAGVDLVLGPLLTLVVFNPTKKSLRWDLSAIGALQLGCLAAGIYVVAQQRPQLLVFTDQGLSAITARDYARLDAPHGQLQTLGGQHPRMVWLDLPEDPAEREVMRVAAMFTGGGELAERHDLYVSIDDPAIRGALASRLETFPDAGNGCRTLPLQSVHGEKTVVLCPARLQEGARGLSTAER